MAIPPRETTPYRAATQLVHAGVERTAHGETSEPIFLTSGFVYDDAAQAEATFKGEATHYQYSRFGNPTVGAFEQRLAVLEGAEACRATATGMAAVHATLLSHLRTGDRVVASRALFGSCFWIVDELLPRYGIERVFVDGHDLDQWRDALRTRTSMVLLETPSNPMLELVDVERVCALAHEAGALVAVDNVFATPLRQLPLALGADIVIYSATKHIDGQGRVLGGAVLGRADWVENTLQPFIRNTGPSLSPFNAWVLLKSLETMAVRVDAAERNAAAVASHLVGRPGIARVLYPGRDDHPQAALARAQMSGGGTLVTIEVDGGKAAAFRFLDALRLVAVSNNLGDSRSLATHPATTTHMRIGAPARARLGIGEGVIRLSIGLEDARDLCEDLQLGLDSIAASPSSRRAMR